MKTLIIVCSALLFSCPLEVFAYTISVFSRFAYNADVATMDATLGLPSSFLFEDFDDSTLIPELHISSNYTGFPNALYLGPFATGGAWTLDNALNVKPTPVTNPTVRFEVVNGIALTIGVGVYGDQGSSARFQINGLGPVITLSDYPNYLVQSGSASHRNGYVKIEQALGDQPIRFVDFFNGVSDQIFYDHIAIDYAAVPEPTTLILIACAGVFATCRQRR